PGPVLGVADFAGVGGGPGRGRPAGPAVGSGTIRSRADDRRVGGAAWKANRTHRLGQGSRNGGGSGGRRRGGAGLLPGPPLRPGRSRTGAGRPRADRRGVPGRGGVRSTRPLPGGRRGHRSVRTGRLRGDPGTDGRRRRPPAGRARGEGRMTGRRILVWVALIGLLAIFLFVLRPGAPGPPLAGSRGPGGTLALRRFLAARGLTVSDAANPPPGGGTFVLLADLRTYEQDSAILQWVDQGGRLVLADPLSELAFRLLVGSRGGLAAIRTTTTLGADCAAPEAVAAGA